MLVLARLTDTRRQSLPPTQRPYFLRTKGQPLPRSVRVTFEMVVKLEYYWNIHTNARLRVGVSRRKESSLLRSSSRGRIIIAYYYSEFRESRVYNCSKNKHIKYDYETLIPCNSRKKTWYQRNVTRGHPCTLCLANSLTHSPLFFHKFPEWSRSRDFIWVNRFMGITIPGSP